MDFSVIGLKEVLSQRPVIEEIDSGEYMPAAVMVLVYKKDSEYCVLLNKRSELVEHHKGEMSFPGGAKDPEDGVFINTALRETEEEMGIKIQDIMILGQLDDVITRSNFVVKVFVGTIDYPYEFNPSDIEIAEVVEIPITELLAVKNQYVETRWDGVESIDSISYGYDRYFIYGATATILSQFLDVISNNFSLEVQVN